MKTKYLFYHLKEDEMKLGEVIKVDYLDKSLSFDYIFPKKVLIK
jgi:hypothetical protein